jgi:hypothetical protein
MNARFFCGTEQRRVAVRDADPAQGMRALNGIDYLEITAPDQRTIEIVFLRALPGQANGVPATPVLTPGHIVIEGGARVTGITVETAAAAAHVLTLTVNKAGDFSMYTLRIVGGPGSDTPPDGFDPLLSEVAFSFKAACPSDFDCAPAVDCPPDHLPEPVIDYLAKDYASFRRLMLDRMAVTVPDWTERNASAVGVALVELLAYAADHLSYHQDAVATEAYLGTARRRISVRRHARLLDYDVHDGTCARAWAALRIDAAADGVILAGPRDIESGAITDSPGTLFLTRTANFPATLSAAAVQEALRHGAVPFEALHDVTLRAAFNELHFHTWNDENCCLPRGATRAHLLNPGDVLADLAPGRVLVFEEVHGVESGRREDADPAHRHAVRITAVRFLEDTLLPEDPSGDAGSQRLRIAEIEWAAADALPFPLCLRIVNDPEKPGATVPVSVAWGNVVLVEQGISRTPETLPAVPDAARYRPLLLERPLAWQARVSTSDGTLLPVDETGPAAAALAPGPRHAAPAIFLREASGANRRWTGERQLLDADAFDREFVAEMEEDGSATLRFGEGVHGSRPDPGSTLVAHYRVGGGSAGNVGADAIVHVASNDPGILQVRNPLPAAGGTDAEPLAQVRLYAPQAFRTQERAVTEADYAAAAERHPEVQRAAATFRWTGSWHTVFLTVDRRNGLPVDATFENELTAFLERFPLAGYDLEIEPPVFVPLDIVLTVCVLPGFLKSDVKRALLDTFSNRVLPDGSRGFFHPDNFTFGQAVFLSRIVATAMAVPGVQRVDTADTPPKKNRFQRFGRPAANEIAEGRIDLARLEIARLDNDPSLPENGRIDVIMEGGI